MKNLCIVIAFTFLIAGCGLQKPYNWYNYSETLNEYRLSPSSESLSNHLKELNKIISTAERKKKTPPPGVCLEYGFLLVQNDDLSTGMQYLSKEIKYYPKSKPFVQKIINKFKNGE